MTLVYSCSLHKGFFFFFCSLFGMKGPELNGNELDGFKVARSVEATGVASASDVGFRSFIGSIQKRYNYPTAWDAFMSTSSGSRKPRQVKEKTKKVGR